MSCLFFLRVFFFFFLWHFSSNLWLKCNCPRCRPITGVTWQHKVAVWWQIKFMIPHVLESFLQVKNLQDCWFFSWFLVKLKLGSRVTTRLFFLFNSTFSPWTHVPRKLCGWITSWNLLWQSCKCLKPGRIQERLTCIRFSLRRHEASGKQTNHRDLRGLLLIRMWDRADLRKRLFKRGSGSNAALRWAITHFATWGQSWVCQQYFGSFKTCEINFAAARIRNCGHQSERTDHGFVSV